MLALRVTYLGELGYELHVPVEYALDLYETALGAPASAHGIANAGYRAINSLRLEKHYLVWGSDITPDYNPYEAGLGFCVAPDKGEFLARAALADVKARGPRAEARRGSRRRRSSTCSAAKSCWPATACWAASRAAVTGTPSDRNILCAYLAADEPRIAAYEIEVMGERYPAVRHTRPLYDPDRRAILA